MILLSVAATLTCAPPCQAANALANEHPSPTGETFTGTIRPFLDSYCVRCHGEKKQKAKRRFDKLSSRI